MDIERVTSRVDHLAGRWGPGLLRWTAGLLWLANVNWKVPPDFGRSNDRCVALCRYVEAGAEFPVAPGSSWFFERIASPNLAVFGWTTLLLESTLVVLLLSGRFVRTAAVLGMAMSAGIGLAVANAEHEWYWSYVLMIVLHLAVLVTASSRPPQSARTMSAVTAGYGVAVALMHAGAGFTGSGAWVLLGQDNDFPGDWGRGTFPGSIAVGLVLVLLGALGWVLSSPAESERRSRAPRIAGWSFVAVSGALLLTYDSDGLIVGLGSRPGNVCIVAALGLALAVTPRPRLGSSGDG